jgi:uncharacterized protein YjbI with pentapeptide repeats
VCCATVTSRQAERAPLNLIHDNLQLQGCVFAEADLSSADLSNCNIQRVDFFAAKLTRANLSGTTGFEARQLRSLAPDLRGIKFTGLDLSNSVAPIKADLMNADFAGCVMHCVQLTGLMPLQLAC